MAGDEFLDLPHRLAVGRLSETVSLSGELDRYAAHLTTSYRYRHEDHFGLFAPRQLRHIILALEDEPQILYYLANLNSAGQIHAIDFLLWRSNGHRLYYQLPLRTGKAHGQ